MKIEKVKIVDLKAPETNVRLHTEKQLKEFIRSLDLFGQTRPAVIDENNVILIGNGMVTAMKQRGDTVVEVVRKMGLSENNKNKLMVADNKVFTLGVDDYDAIDKIINELQNDLDIPGFDEEILQSMISSVEEVTEQMKEFGTLDQETIQGIKDKAEQSEEKQISKQDDSTGSLSLGAINMEDVPVQQEHTTADVKKTIICPKCGEEICL